MATVDVAPPRRSEQPAARQNSACRPGLSQGSRWTAPPGAPPRPSHRALVPQACRSWDRDHPRTPQARTCHASGHPRAGHPCGSATWHLRRRRPLQYAADVTPRAGAPASLRTGGDGTAPWGAPTCGGCTDPLPTGNHLGAGQHPACQPVTATTPNAARQHGASCVGLVPTGRPCRQEHPGACSWCRPPRRNEAAAPPAPWPRRCAASVSPPAPWPRQAPRASATPALGTGRGPARRPRVAPHRRGRACARARTRQGQGPRHGRMQRQGRTQRQGRRGALPSGPAQGRAGDPRSQCGRTAERLPAAAAPEAAAIPAGSGGANGNVDRLRNGPCTPTVPVGRHTETHRSNRRPNRPLFALGAPHWVRGLAASGRLGRQRPAYQVERRDDRHLPHSLAVAGKSEMP